MRPGSLIAGKYRVSRVLSDGGTAVVFEALHEALGQKVAVKVLPAEAANDPEAALRFQREARLAARIPGDHVARVSDFGVGADGSLFIVFELLEGRDLQQEIEAKGQLSLREAVDHVLQACVGVAEAHALGLVHRDLKPANLFLTQRRDGTALVKVLDFGVAKALNELSSTVTGSGNMATPSFAAPEQLRSFRDAGPKADQHALAGTLFALLVGRPPYQGATLPDLMQQILSSPAPRPSQLRPGVPAPMDSILARALAKRPDDRYPDLRAFSAAIAPFGSAVSRAHVATIERALGAAPAGPPAGAQPQARAVVPELSEDDEVATVARPGAKALREEALRHLHPTAARSNGHAPEAAANQRQAPPPEPSGDDEGPTQVFRGGSDASRPEARLAELMAQAPAQAALAPPPPREPPRPTERALAVPAMPPLPALPSLAQRVPQPPGGLRQAGTVPAPRSSLAATRLLPRKRSGAAGTALTIGLLVLCAVLGALVTYFLAGGSRSVPSQSR